MFKLAQRTALVTLLLSVSAYASENKCGLRLEAVPTLKTLLVKADEAATGSAASVTNFDDAEAASARWEGIDGPKLFQDGLPTNVKFISHPLIHPNERGLVKVDSAEFTSLRANVQFQGKSVGTNVGVLRTALVDNFTRDNKSLVRKDAKAVVLFMHGGGTRTTGHHVGVSMQNHFAGLGIDIISFDQGFHGEGPRQIFQSPREYFDWVRAFVEQFVAQAGVPVYLAGHSMGGEFADVYMRLYPNDSLIKGVMALSPVVDTRPGGTPTQKVLEARRKSAELAKNPNVAPEDLELLDSLIKQNKTSPLGWFFESLFALHNDWTVPADGGASYIPALYVWGTGDWLYAGNEELIRNYLSPLKNVTVKTYDKRLDVKGREITVGHLIFDHHRPGTQTLEAFLDIQEFIGKTAQIQFDKVKKSQTDGMVGRLIQSYANNLAFREFLKSYSFLAHDPTPKTKEDGPKSGRDPIIRLKLSNKYVPEGPEGEQGRAWLMEIQGSLQVGKKGEQTEDSLLGRLKAAHAQRETLKTRQAELQQRERVVEMEIREIISSDNSAAWHHLRAEEKKLMSDLRSAQERMGHAIEEFYLERMMSPEGRRNFTPTPHLKELFHELDGKMQDYQRLLARMDDTARRDHHGAARLQEEFNALNNQLEDNERNIMALQNRLDELQANLAATYSSEYFTINRRRAWDALQVAGKDWKSVSSVLQTSWQQWLVLWRERPPAEAGSYY